MELLRHERQVAEALAEYSARRRDGARDAAAFAARLEPEAQALFLELVEIEHTLDSALGDETWAGEGATADDATADGAPAPAGRLVLMRVLAVAAVVVLGFLVWQFATPGSSGTGPAGPEEPVTLARLEQDLLGAAPQVLYPRNTHRGVELEVPIPPGLLPTGPVLFADLDKLVLGLGELPSLEGRLVLRSSDGTVLHERALLRDDTTMRVDVPAEVKDAVRTGGTVHWSFEASDGKSYGTTFEVVDIARTKAIEKRLDALRERTSDRPRPERAWLEAALLLQEGLHASALKRAALAARAPSEEGSSPLPWIQMREALHRMDLLDSLLGGPVEEALDLFPPADLEAIYEARAP